MKRTIAHQEIGGGYSSDGPKIIVDTTEIFPGEYETMALYGNGPLHGEELDSRTADNEADALRDFREILTKHLRPLQAAVFGAGMIPGEKYTILHYNEFGFLIAQKIRFHSVDCTTYAQYGDAVTITCTPFRKRGKYRWTLYNKSFAIYAGWQDLPESALWDVISENEKVTVKQTKYCCWNADGFTACKGILKNCLMVYEDFKTGKNGKVYA